MPDYVAKLRKELIKLVHTEVSKAARTTGLAQSSIEGGGVRIFDSQGNYLTSLGMHPDGHYGVGHAIDSTVITPGGIETPSLAANSITADKLEALLVLVSAIVAGDPAGVAAVMDATGFRTVAVDGEGNQYVSTRLGSAEGDSLQIMSAPDSPPVASISSAGDISGNTLATNTDVTIQGTPLVGKVLDPAAPAGILDAFSQGCVTAVDFRPLVDGITITAGASTSGIGQFTTVLAPGRVCRFEMPWRAYTTAASGQSKVNITSWLYATYAGDASTEPPDPSTSDIPVGHQSQTFAAGGTGINDTFSFPIMTPAREDGASVQVKFLLGLWAQYGDFSPDFTQTPDLSSWIATVTDQGAAPALTTATPPGSASTVTYTTTWNASDSHTWLWDGSRYDTGGSRPAPGSILLQNGVPDRNTHGAILFNSTASKGEHKTIAAALAGATIVRAELFLWQTWSEDDTGQVEVRPWTGTALPSSKAPPGTSSNIVKHDYTARSQGAWFDIPTSWITPTQTGVWIASPDWGFPVAHINLAGATYATGSARPQLRLTYRR